MKIQFIGVGSAFTTWDYYQSNMLISGRNGKSLLLDCGSDARFGLAELGLSADKMAQVEAVFISHLHADHIGSLEWLAFITYFNPTIPRPKLFMERALMHELWEHSLQGGLGSIGEKLMHLTDFFECHALPPNGSFEWNDIHFQLHRMPHIMNGYRNHYSYGLYFHEKRSDAAEIFISTDTLLQPDLLTTLAPAATCIFHDTETAPFKTGVHAHYEDLRELPAEIKRKIWLYHYQPQPPYTPEKDGFCGFVQKGQVFEFE